MHAHEARGSVSIEDVLAASLAAAPEHVTIRMRVACQPPPGEPVARRRHTHGTLRYNSKMPRATASISLRAMLLLTIVLMQLLSPLLHGHLGTPKQSGLHVHAALPAAVDSHFQFTSFAHRSPSDESVWTGLHDWALTSHEPFEVDVEPAIGPAKLAAFLWAASAAGVSALTFLLLAALAGAAVLRPAYRPTPVRARSRDRVNRPPPAQAPPLQS
ncbi:hypothetical protein [Ralstonia sp. SET104]|uniref:hypothetical protein n=1 Tax=Ralstonia sp. SET104 TaxID=2448774 RepID=UPI0021AA44C3|nr:hypothetical protein [Ralstonia sp. SET104]